MTNSYLAETHHCAKLGAARFGVRGWLGAALALLLAACAVPPIEPDQAKAQAIVGSEFACGGALETRTWQLWDEQGRRFMKEQLISARLLAQGDPYALYDLQSEFHNLQAMAERCSRVHRLVQLADDLMPVFERLEPLQGNLADLAWICRGGNVCSERSRELHQEEMLASAQGLGLLSALANALTRTPDPMAQAHPLIAKTVLASVAHLRRWGAADARTVWARIAGASVQDINSGSGSLFFSDKHLWQLAIYANVAGVAVMQPALVPTLHPGTAQNRELGQAIAALLHLLERRLTLQTVDSPRLGHMVIADLDAGFWRLYGGNRYAGYDGTAPPALCVKTASGMQVQMQVDLKDVPIVKDLGWDFSHARRLVPALDALQRNRHALQVFYALDPKAMPSSELARNAAAQLVVKIWNGDVERPLFANYWNGSNGWYRVEVDSGTKVCHSGYRPFGLSHSFPTGGYGAWGEYYPIIDMLGRQIYRLADSPETNAIAFVSKYYSGLSNTTSPISRAITQLMFWPTLVR